VLAVDSQGDAAPKVCELLQTAFTSSRACSAGSGVVGCSDIVDQYPAVGQAISERSPTPLYSVK
jgi:hypothetical protein